jgi:homoserine dehydrogenase
VLPFLLLCFGLSPVQALLTTNNMGADNTVTFAGPGAGRYPTANSVVSDLIRVSLNKVAAPFPLTAAPDSITLDSTYVSRFYFRVTTTDQVDFSRYVCC